jgi:hypothetical protein
VNLTLAQVLVRIASADQTRGAYHMGAGAKRAAALSPWAKFECKDGTILPLASDCSATLCWAMGVDKHDRALGVWWNTDAIVRDAKGPQRRWKQLAAPVPGCGVVYGGHLDEDGDREAGHCGIVKDVAGRLTWDCGSSSWRKGKDAITVRQLSSFWGRPSSLPQPIFVVPVTMDLAA